MGRRLKTKLELSLETIPDGRKGALVTDAGIGCTRRPTSILPWMPLKEHTI